MVRGYYSKLKYKKGGCCRKTQGAGSENTMIKINVETLAGALKKLKGFTEKTVILDFSLGSAGDGDERFMQVSACNGTAQANVLTYYTGDNAEAKRYIVSSSFIETVDTLAGLGDELLIEEVDGSLKVSCGTAVVPVQLMTDGTTLKMKNIEKLEHLRLTVSAKDFSEVVFRGGFGTGDATMGVPLFAGTVVFSLVEENDKFFLRAFSCCNAFVASATVDVSVKDTATFKKYAAGGCTAVNYAAISALAKRVTNEAVELIFTDKQMILTDGADVYLFTVVEGAAPSQIVSLVSTEVEREFSYTLDREALRKCLAVVALTKDKIVKFAFEEDKVVLSDSKYTSRVECQATAAKAEKKEIVMSAEFVKNIATAMPESFEVYGPKNSTGLFFTGSGCKTFLMPIMGA